MKKKTIPARWPDKVAAGPDITDFMAPTFGIEVPKSDDPIFATLLEALMAEDTLAVNLARSEQEDKSRKADFQLALEQGIEAVSSPHEALTKFFDFAETRPTWADEAVMAEAGKIHFRLGKVGRLSSGTLGLMAGYQNSAVAKTLCATGSLATATPRRIAETAKFIFDVCDSNGMGRFSQGFKSSVMVRKVHAYVRSGLSRSPNWHTDLWGPPVSIMDSLSTAMAFWIPSVLSQEKLGHSLTRDEQYAMMTLWNYVAYLQGVPDELLPKTVEQAYKLYCCLRMTWPAADEDSLELANCLFAVSGYKDGKYASMQSRLYHGTVAGLFPQEYMDALHIPQTFYRHWLKVLKPTVARREARCRRDPAFLAKTQREGRESMKSAYNSIVATFDPDKVIANQDAISSQAQSSSS